MLFTNEAQMRSLISGKLQVAVNYVLQQIFDENNKDVLEIVYQSYSGSYPRTGEFANAWEVVEGGFGDAGGEFRFASHKLSASPKASNEDYPIHADVHGNSVTEYMADILYQGGMGCIYRPTNRNAYKVLDTWLSNTRFRKIFEDGMTAAGIPWKRSTGAVNVVRWSK